MKTVLIIGLGRFGRHIAEKFIEEGNDVLAIEKDEEKANNSVSFLSNIQIGDASDERFVASLGAKFIIARACRSVHQKLLLRNGADHVVYAEKEMAQRLAVKYGAKNIFDYIELTPEIGIYETAVPQSWVGKSIIEKSIRTKYNVSILAVKKDGKIFPLPSPDRIFEADETLMVMGSQKDIKAITK